MHYTLLLAILKKIQLVNYFVVNILSNLSTRLIKTLASAARFIEKFLASVKFRVHFF